MLAPTPPPQERGRIMQASKAELNSPMSSARHQAGVLKKQNQTSRPPGPPTVRCRRASEAPGETVSQALRQVSLSLERLEAEQVTWWSFWALSGDLPLSLQDSKSTCWEHPAQQPLPD